MEAQQGQKLQDPRPVPLLPGRHLRQATLIIPSTGERIKRDFTLRDPAWYQPPNSNTQSTNERTPLLSSSTKPLAVPDRLRNLLSKAKDVVVQIVKQSAELWRSDTGHGILKCSLAYFIATLATFSLPIARILGTHQDGNQLVANVVVWFDPARSLGSMELAMLLAILAYVYGVLVCFASMVTAGFFEQHDLLVVGHIIILLLFIGGALGILSWVKQKFNNPTLNVACSVSSLAIVTVIIKEGAVQNGEFSLYKITQILKMLGMGVLISVIINLAVWPISARAELRESLTKSTDAFGDLLAKVTGTFLSGLEEDMNHPVMVAASDRFKSVFSSLPKHLAEAKWEHYLLGTENRYHIEEQLVKHLQQLAQDLGGLRSAAATQFSLLSESKTQDRPGGLKTPYKFDNQKRNLDHLPEDFGMDDSTRMLASIEEMPDEETSPGIGLSTSANSLERTKSIVDPQSLQRTKSTVDPQSLRTPAEVFETFIAQLGPPMKSLAFTLREILNNLPYGPAADHASISHPIFRSSLAEAIKLFSSSRREALEQVYMSKELRASQNVDIAADFEEVAASCGHFTSSLQDFAENCLKYIDVLNELAADLKDRRIGRTWMWLLFWRKHVADAEEGEVGAGDRDPTARNTPPPTTTKSHVPMLTSDSTLEKPYVSQAFPYRLWPYLRFWRREDIRFAIKVGGGATVYAMFAYIPSTRDFFNEWHMEWGLAAYMLVCSMTVGASNYTGWSRVYGTLIGGAAATMVWLVSSENPYALAILGWVVSVVCYYYIQARDQAPMGRFILLTYNLSVLYTFALSVQDPDAKLPHEYRGKMEIFTVVFHRVVSILMGCISGLFVTRMIWPIQARKKLKYGLSLLWLRMALIWKRAPLSTLTEEGTKLPSYMDLASETNLREYVDTLDGLRKNAESEFKLRGPFLTESWDALLQSTTRMLDGFHALNVLVQKDLKASPGEAEILLYTNDEREQLARRISHLLSVLASSLSMEYPLTDALPDVVHTRDRLLAKVFEFRLSTSKKNNPSDEDYEILYAYALVTAQIAKEINTSGKEIEKLFGKLSEDVLKLQ